MSHIKDEVDTEPTLGFSVENRFIKASIPVSISTVVESDLFACKLNVALYRAWTHRVKERDWYDIVWFIHRDIPLNLTFGEKCMQSNGELGPDE